MVILVVVIVTVVASTTFMMFNSTSHVSFEKPMLFIDTYDMSLPEKYQNYTHIKKYTYNESKDQIKSETFVDGEITSKSETDYDKNGKEKENRLYTNRVDINIPFETTEFIKNEDERKVTEKVAWGNHGGTFKEIEYDKNGNNIKQLNYANGNVFANYTSFYDDNNNLIKLIDILHGNKIIRHYQYDDENNRISHSGVKEDDSFRFLEVYAYDEKNNKTDEKEFDSEGKLVSWTKLTYDLDFRITSEMSSFYDDRPIFSKGLKYEYDDNGSTLIREFIKGTERFYSVTILDDMGNKVAYKRVNSNNDKIEQWTQWSYDDEGRLLERNLWKPGFMPIVSKSVDIPPTFEH